LRDPAGRAGAPLSAQAVTGVLALALIAAILIVWRYA
jgi:hypothetical protein